MLLNQHIQEPFRWTLASLYCRFIPICSIDTIRNASNRSLALCLVPSVHALLISSKTPHVWPSLQHVSLLRSRVHLHSISFHPHIIKQPYIDSDPFRHHSFIIYHTSTRIAEVELILVVGIWSKGVSGEMIDGGRREMIIVMDEVSPDRAVLRRRINGEVK